MSHKSHLVGGRSALFSWLAVFLIAVALAVCASAGNSQAQAQVEPRCELLPTKTRVVLCEPLVADLRLTNIGSRELYVTRSVSLEQGGIRVTYTRPDGTQRRYEPLDQVHTMGERQAVPPGASFYRRLFLAYSSDIGPEVPCEYLFSSPGVYRIQASIWVYEGPVGGDATTLNSEPVEVTAAEPRGADAEALRLFRGKEQGLALHIGEGDESEKLKEFDALVSLYPQSTYTQYVQYTSLVSALRERGTGLLELGSETPAEVRATFEQLAAFVQTYDGFAAVDELMLYLAECYDRTREPERAAELRAEILSRFPDGAVAALLRSGDRIRVRSITAVVKE